MADFNLTQVNSLLVLLQSEYDALSTKDPDTLYVAKASDESNVSNIYLGIKSMNDVIIINNPDTEDINEGRLYITYDTNSVCLFTVENSEIKVISGGSGSGSSPVIVVDTTLSTTSTNPVQNKVITNRILQIESNLDTEENARITGDSTLDSKIDSEILRATTKENSLDSRIDALSGHGKFLSTWNSTTGRPGTFPEAIPYTYHTGDYYIVGNVSTTVNYKPSGTSYTGVASTEEEILNVEQNDTYWFDGYVWQLQKNNVPDIAIDDHLDDTSTNPVQNRVIVQALNSKADKQVIESCSILVTDWENLTSAELPFKYSSTYDVTYTMGDDSVIELINDNPVNFAKYGFVVGSTSGLHTVTFYSIEKPTETVTLKVGFVG